MQAAAATNHGSVAPTQQGVCFTVPLCVRAPYRRHPDQTGPRLWLRGTRRWLQARANEEAP
jgi:hypothetical protein